MRISDWSSDVCSSDLEERRSRIRALRGAARDEEVRRLNEIEEARRRAAEEEARLKAEQEDQRRAEEEARRRVDEEARRTAEEEPRAAGPEAEVRRPAQAAEPAREQDRERRVAGKSVSGRVHLGGSRILQK